MLELNKIYCMDCLDGLKQLDDKSIDLSIIDSPYYKVMIKDHLGKKYEWDNQWNTLKEYIHWCKQWFKELHRIIKSNGSLYVFADDKISAYVQIELDKLFHLENSIVWVKINNMTIKGWKKYRCFAPITERILFYSKETRNTNLENECYFENVQVFAPVIEYMIEQKRLIKEYFNFKTDKEFNNYVNNITNTSSVVSRHYFTYSQWVFPTKEIYQKLQSINKEIFKKEYEVFKKEYEEKRRTFNPSKNYTDIWKSYITSSSEKTYHPTQKPIALIRHLIKASSNENDCVLDCFMGGGTTAVACRQLKRNFIGFEINPEYIKIANKRLNEPLIHKWIK